MTHDLVPDFPCKLIIKNANFYLFNISNFNFIAHITVIKCANHMQHSEEQCRILLFENVSLRNDNFRFYH